MGSVLSCVKDHEEGDVSRRSSTAPVEAPLASYLLEPSAATPSTRLWMQSFNRQRLPLPAAVVAAAPPVVHAAAAKEAPSSPKSGSTVDHQSLSSSPTSSSTTPSVYQKYVFAQWSAGLNGLDEVFEQCRQVCAARRGCKGVLSSTAHPQPMSTNTFSAASSVAATANVVITVPDESGRPSRCDSVGDDGDSNESSGEEECEKSVPELTDAFSGYALSHLMACLHMSNEAHVFYLIYVLMLDSRRDMLAGTSPSKWKQVFDIQEWSVTRSVWIDGWLRNGCTSVSQARSFCRQLASTFDALLLDESTFRSFHKFLFRFLIKDAAAARGAVSREKCASIWRIVFAKRWTLIDYFVNYVQRHYDRNYITADQWDSIPEFACAVRYELNLLQYDVSKSSWPSLMDDFVAHTVHSFEGHDVESRCSSS